MSCLSSLFPYIRTPAVDVKPVFLGSHPAMDFLNTSFTPQGAAVEVIGDGPAFLDWLVTAELLDAPAAAKLKQQGGGLRKPRESCGLP